MSIKKPNKLIHNPLSMTNPQHIASVMSQHAAQENCDSYEYDLLQLGSDYIRELERTLKRLLEYDISQVVRKTDIYKANKVLYGEEAAKELFLKR